MGNCLPWGFYVRHVDGLIMKNIKIKIKESDYRPALVFDDVKNLNIQSIQIGGDKKSNHIIFNNVENAEIEDEQITSGDFNEKQLGSVRSH